MTYVVHSVFKTIQGEGFHAGRVAVFCRFAGCNLWTGREQDRSSAVCQFCDTDFVGGKRYEAFDLAEEIAQRSDCRLVVFTGGEPYLQLDQHLIDAVRQRDFLIHVETNGTIPGPLVDWITVSPKAGTRIVHHADELKVIFPQNMDYEAIRLDMGSPHNFLQPMDGPDIRKNTADAIEYILDHPWWRLSLQTHKFAGIA